MASLSKNFDFNLRRDHQKKISMTVATMSRSTKRAYLKLCLEKLRKKNSGSKGLKKIKFTKLFNPFTPSESI